jgi:hypothetical protein
MISISEGLYCFAMRRNYIGLYLIVTAGMLASCSKPAATSPSGPTSATAAPTGPTAAAASSSGASQFAQALGASKPIAYFRLESPSGSSDAGGAAYVSTAGVSGSTACAPISVPGNQCLALNGKDGAITTTQQGGVQTAGSIMAWVNLNVLPSKSDHILYVAGISESGNDFDLQFERDDALRFFTSGGGSVEYKPDPASLVGKWHMIVATLDTVGKTRAIYWDGKLGQVDTGGGSPNKKNLFSIGESTVFKGRFFNGSMDEVALWDRALTGAEVAKLYGAINP